MEGVDGSSGNSDIGLVVADVLVAKVVVVDISVVCSNIASNIKSLNNEKRKQPVEYDMLSKIRYNNNYYY